MGCPSAPGAVRVVFPANCDTVVCAVSVRRPLAGDHSLVSEDERLTSVLDVCEDEVRGSKEKPRGRRCIRRPLSILVAVATYLVFEVAATHLPNASRPVPYFAAKAVALALRAALHDVAAVVSVCACAATDFETACETHLPKAFSALPLPFEVLLP